MAFLKYAVARAAGANKAEATNYANVPQEFNPPALTDLLDGAVKLDKEQASKEINDAVDRVVYSDYDSSNYPNPGTGMQSSGGWVGLNASSGVFISNTAGYTVIPQG